MSKYAIESTTLTNIASAIRSKKGTSDSYTPLEMPAAISSISGGGGGGINIEDVEIINITNNTDEEITAGKIYGYDEYEWQIIEGVPHNSTSYPFNSVNNSMMVRFSDRYVGEIRQGNGSGSYYYTGCYAFYFDTTQEATKQQRTYTMLDLGHYNTSTSSSYYAKPLFCKRISDIYLAFCSAIYVSSSSVVISMTIIRSPKDGSEAPTVATSTFAQSTQLGVSVYPNTSAFPLGYSYDKETGLLLITTKHRITSYRLTEETILNGTCFTPLSYYELTLKYPNSNSSLGFSSNDYWIQNSSIIKLNTNKYYWALRFDVKYSSSYRYSNWEIETELNIDNNGIISLSHQIDNGQDQTSANNGLSITRFGSKYLLTYTTANEPIFIAYEHFMPSSSASLLPQSDTALGAVIKIGKYNNGTMYNNLVKYYIAYNDARSEAHLVLLQNNYFAIITRTRVMSFKYNESSNLIELIEQRVFANSLVTDNGAGNLLYKLDTNNFAIEYPSKYALPYYHTFRLFLNISNNGKINISSVNFPSISYDQNNTYYPYSVTIYPINSPTTNQRCSYGKWPSLTAMSDLLCQDQHEFDVYNGGYIPETCITSSYCGISKIQKKDMIYKDNGHTHKIVPISNIAAGGTGQAYLFK